MSRTLRTLIADDEPPARRRLADLLGAEPDVTVVAQCSSGAAAIAALAPARSVDLAFLDVQMPDGTGLDVVRAIGPDAMPLTVFATAYDRYALDAFELAAADYLLKPFTNARFAQTMQRARERLDAHDSGAALARVLGALAPPDALLDRIAVDDRGEHLVVPLADVDWFEAQGAYVAVRTGGRSYLTRERMSALEARLDPRRFCRIHRSAIANLDRVERIRPTLGGDWEVVVDGTPLRVSRSRRDEVARRLGVR